MDAFGGVNHLTSLENSMILEDIKVLKDSFSNCQFNWIKRQANIAIHELSRWSSKTNLLFVFSLFPPKFYEAVINDDELICNSSK